MDENEFILAIKIKMKYDEKTDDVKATGVEFEAIDSDGEVVDMNDELKELAKDMLKGFQEEGL